MILTIDGLARRYGRLPYQILSEASTFDLYIMSTAVSWTNHQQELARAGVSGQVPHRSQEELRSILDQVRVTK